MKTLQEFYDFYSAIPDEQWGTGNFINDDGTCCAAGLLGKRVGFGCPEFATLCELLDLFPGAIYSINDNPIDHEEGTFLQLTPKARILALIKSKMNV